MKLHFIIAEAIEVVKGFGYDCYVVKYNSQKENEEHRYCYITDGVNIGYMQVDDFNSGVNFGTVHKPNSKCGDSFRLTNPKPLSKAFDSIFTIEQIDDNIIKCCFGKPQWARKFIIEKWASWENYTKNSLSAKLGAEFIKI